MRSAVGHGCGSEDESEQDEMDEMDEAAARGQLECALSAEVVASVEPCARARSYAFYRTFTAPRQPASPAIERAVVTQMDQTA